MALLSVVLATFNEEDNIVDCLKLITGTASEIIIVDGSSTDRTVLLAKKFGAKVITVPNKMMFHENKQLALEKAKNEWILQLDADERLTPALKQEILNTINNKTTEKQNNIKAYYIPRKNFFLGSFLAKGGQYPDYVIRLVKNGSARFPCKSVHEQIKVTGDIGYLHNNIIHLGNKNFTHYLRNSNRYTTLTAIELDKKNIPLSFKNQFYYLVWMPTKTFLNIYIRHKGFIDGFPGFIFALFSALHFVIAYIKYWEKFKLKHNFDLGDWE